MWQFLLKTFDTHGFPRRWDCGEAWTPAHGWLHVCSDVAIFGAYAAIPLVLAYFVLRRKDLPFPPIFWLFAAFILFCGIGHLIEATLFWHPWYRLSAIVKLLTALVSWATVFALVRVMPLALSLPGIAQTNARLEKELQEKELARRQLQAAHDQLEQRVRERTADLQRSNADLERFAYVASHDLQEPLRAVVGFCRLLQKQYQGRLDAVADEHIHFIVDGATRMKALLESVLAYSRVDQKGVAPQPVASGKCLESALANLAVAVTEASATVTRDDLPTINCDADQLTQLFQNLIGNAVKYRGDEPCRVHVSAEKRDDNWVFAIKDNGIGISAEHADSVFEIFRRLHAREQYSGTGIGLAVCRRIVERHRGAIWVESEPKRGTTFYFSLPITQDGDHAGSTRLVATGGDSAGRGQSQ